MSAPLSPARAVGLVVRREFRNRVQTKAFLIGTLALIVILGGYLAFLTFVGNQGSKQTLGITSNNSALAQPLQASATALGKELVVRDVATDAGQEQVRSGDLDAVLIGGPGSYQLIGKDQVDDTLRALVQSTIAQQTISNALVKAGVDTAAVTAQAQVSVSTLQPRAADFGTRLAIGLISAGLLYLAILIYGQTLAQGVLEEKTSRVIELLLSTLKPWQLMAGKIIGVGAAGLLQFTLIGAIGAVGAKLTGVLTLPEATPITVVAGIVWFLLGFALFATLYAAAGSLVSRSEDLQAVVTPITLLVVIPFAASFTIINNPTGNTAVVLSLIPFFAPILMPILISLGAAALWQVALAVALTVVTTIVLAVLGGRVYANSVLRTGSRVRLRDALSRTG